MRHRATPVLQRFDRIEARRRERGIHPEEEADRAPRSRCRARPTTARPRPGIGVNAAIAERDRRRRAIVPMTPPSDRQHDRLDQELREDVRAPRAERLAHADLARPLGDRRST